MSGAVSGSQFQFVPRIAQQPAVEDPEAWSGPAGREFTGPRSVEPIARGAFSTQHRALAFRQQRDKGPHDKVMSHGAENIGSWLFKAGD